MTDRIDNKDKSPADLAQLEKSRLDKTLGEKIGRAHV